MPDYFLTRVTAPAVPLISTADAKAHLRVDFADDDDLIDGLVQAANDLLDGEVGILGRALITQTWSLTLAKVPQGWTLQLPIPRVQSVSSITYYDTDNASQTFAASEYRLVSTDEYGLVELALNATWPALYTRADAMTVEFVTGYGDAASDVPQPIVQAALLLVSHWYEMRGAATDKTMAALPMGVQALLMNYRLVRGHI